MILTTRRVSLPNTLHLLILLLTPTSAQLLPVLPLATIATPSHIPPEDAPQPTAPPRFDPRLLRRASKTEADPFWDDKEICNIGVCNVGSFCSVYASEGTAMGSCVTETTSGVRFTECVPYEEDKEHRYNTLRDGKLYCGKNNHICATRAVEFGYKLEWFNMVWCRASSLEEEQLTSLNRSWRLYDDIRKEFVLASATKEEEEEPETTKEFVALTTKESEKEEEEEEEKGTAVEAETKAPEDANSILIMTATHFVGASSTPVASSTAEDLTASQTPPLATTSITTGTLIGIIIGAVLGGALIAGALIWFILRRRIPPPPKGSVMMHHYQHGAPPPHGTQIQHSAAAYYDHAAPVQSQPAYNAGRPLSTLKGNPMDNYMSELDTTAQYAELGAHKSVLEFGHYNPRGVVPGYEEGMHMGHERGGSMSDGRSDVQSWISEVKQ